MPVAPGMRGTHIGYLSAVTGRQGEGRWVLGWEECRRSGIWWSEGGRGRNVGRGRGKCACVGERMWSSGEKAAGGRWTGGAGSRRSADGRKRRRKTRKMIGVGRCSCRVCRHWGCWWREEATLLASSVRRTVKTEFNQFSKKDIKHLASCKQKKNTKDEKIISLFHCTGALLLFKLLCTAVCFDFRSLTLRWGTSVHKFTAECLTKVFTPVLV